MTLPATPTPSFDVFLKYDALTRLLFDYADAHPTLVSVDSIGKSHEGRDIWVATVTNTASGVAADKPAFWADGNIHAAELTASTACLYWLHQLVAGAPTPSMAEQLLGGPGDEPRVTPDHVRGLRQVLQRVAAALRFDSQGAAGPVPGLRGAVAGTQHHQFARLRQPGDHRRDPERADVDRAEQLADPCRGHHCASELAAETAATGRAAGASVRPGTRR